MASLVFILCLLPFLTNGDIDIIIRYSSPNDFVINGTGTATTELNTDVEDLFAINDERLRTGVEALAGSRPDAVFLRDPTGSYGNQFQINQWEPTYHVITPIQFNLISVKTRNITVETRINRNIRNGSMPSVASFESVISHNISNTWSTGTSFFWLRGSTFRFTFTVGERRPFPTLDDLWGSFGNSMTDSVIVANIISQMIPARRTLEIELLNEILSVEVLVVYESELRGNVVGYWKNGHHGHQFWPFDVQRVLRWGGMPMHTFTHSMTELRMVTPKITVRNNPLF